MTHLEHYITLALEGAGVPISPDMRGEIADLERDIIDKAVAEMKREMRKPDPLGEALNSGDGTYRP